jgi:molecular chaperone GrpE
MTGMQDEKQSTSAEDTEFDYIDAAELDALRAERDELRDKFMRALADAENARKRADRDRREAEQYGGSRLARDLLPVHDALRRALDAVGEDQRSAIRRADRRRGADPARTSRRVRAARGLVISPSAGDAFDPQVHQAMFEAPVPGTVSGTVLQCMADGFMLHDRLLRPAQVGVSSNPG